MFDLRHTAITTMPAEGADLKATNEVAGHANVGITQSVYQHIKKKQRHINGKQRATALYALTGAFGELDSGPFQAVSQGA